MLVQVSATKLAASPVHLNLSGAREPSNVIGGAKSSQ